MQMADQLLKGQKALVTGANSGIGEGIAKALAAAGAAVVVNYVARPEAAEQVVNDITIKGGTAIAIQADVSKEDQVKTLFEKMFNKYDTIDILVNNAGLQRDAAFIDMTIDDWNFVLSVNLTGQFLCAREAAREFIRRGVVPSISKAAGKIICISSVHEVIPWSGHCNYAASKGGVMLFMKSIAQELREQHRPGRHQNTHQSHSLGHTGGGGEASQTYPLQSRGSFRRHRRRSGLACFRRVGICAWGDPHGRWWHVPLSWLCRGRLTIGNTDSLRPPVLTNAANRRLSKSSSDTLSLSSSPL
jgi:NADP-dependent 3-hydroxy acid dehydrogenase YdfG